MNKKDVLEVLNRLLESNGNKLTKSQRELLVKEAIKKVEEGGLTVEQLLEYIIKIGVIITEINDTFPFDT